MAKDYYQMLGVPRNSSDGEIKKAYRKMAMKYHPDRPGGDSEKMKIINKAYEVIGDEQNREYYDIIHAEYLSPPSAWSFTSEKRRKPSSMGFWDNIQNLRLKDFIFDSIIIFQEKMRIKIPSDVTGDFKTAVF